MHSDPEDARDPEGPLDSIDTRDPQGRAALSEEEIAARFRADYPRFQYALIEFLAAHLADLSREFEGDLQQPLILAVLGQRFLGWRAEVERAGGADPGWRPAMAASRIADVTGVPRETVRRKLRLLAARGWIEQGADGGWALLVRDGVSLARADLGDLDARGVNRAARLLASLRALR
jgi:hypothetical protein